MHRGRGSLRPRLPAKSDGRSWSIHFCAPTSSAHPASRRHRPAPADPSGWAEPRTAARRLRHHGRAGSELACGARADCEATFAFALGWSLRALYARLRRRTGLGLGDVKFLRAATAWTGLEHVPVLILIASGTALAALALDALSGQRIGAATRLPFGPFLAIGLHAGCFLRRWHDAERPHYCASWPTLRIAPITETISPPIRPPTAIVTRGVVGASNRSMRWRV